MEKYGNLMENNQNIDYAARIINIHEKMKHTPSWKNISDVYKVLEKEFEHELDDFPSSYDTFHKQLKGKGSKKHFKLYFDYLMSLDDVKLKHSESTNKLFSNIIAILITVFLTSVFIFTIQDDTFDKLKYTQSQEYKQCVKQCLDVSK
jgi:translation initiation factor 2 alpha subunit (eIF-2alpha)